MKMMKQIFVAALMVACVPVMASAEVLFSDTFDRPDSTNLNASAVGKSGTYASALYVEVTDNLITNDALTNIGTNRLSMADGPQASALHIDQNFAVSEITTEGGFRVTLSGLHNDGTLNGKGYFAGFGVGISASETSVYGFDNDSTALLPGLKGNQGGTVAGSGVADWFLALSRRNGTDNQRLTVEVWQNGLLVNTFATDDDGASFFTDDPEAAAITVEFAVTGFGAGATVVPTIYAGDRTFGSADDLSFTWTDADANYIGLAGRESDAGWSMDGFSIEAIPLEIDTTPPAAPTSLAISTNMAMFELTWDANSEPDLAFYSVYRSTTSGSYGDPIASGLTTNAFNTGAPTVGTDYYYLVTASDGSANESAGSGEVSGSISDAETQVFFVLDTGDVYGFNSIASNGWNTVDAQLVTNGTLLASVPEYTNYQAFANLPNGEIYGVSAAGDVLQWSNLAAFLSGEGAATVASTGNYIPESGKPDRIHGASYDPNTGGFYAVLESNSNPPDGDVVLYTNLTAFIDNTPYSTNVAGYAGNVANFYYNGDDVPNNYTSYTNLAGAAYFDLSSSGRLAGFMTLDDYITAGTRRTFELNGFAGNREIRAAFAVLASLTSIGDLSILPLSTTTVELSWPAEALGTYAVQATESLTSGSWSNIVSGIQGVDGTLSVTTTVSGAQSFYRISGE